MEEGAGRGGVNLLFVVLKITFVYLCESGMGHGEIRGGLQEFHQVAPRDQTRGPCSAASILTKESFPSLAWDSLGEKTKPGAGEMAPSVNCLLGNVRTELDLQNPQRAKHSFVWSVWL